MQVAVIGGGVVGVCTAYFLAAEGHEVVVIERHGNVAEEASFGHAGLIAPGNVTPWAAPGMPEKLLSSLFYAESPLQLKPKMERTLWKWLRLWFSECDFARFRTNKERMQRVACYSQDILRQIREHYELEFEQTQGLLHIFRNERDTQLLQTTLELLSSYELPYKVLDADAARLIEPALATTTPFASALHLPNDGAGNCALFTKQLKSIAQSIGVEFYFNSVVSQIHSDHYKVSLQVDAKEFTADAVVIAAGTESAQLLKSLGISIPLYPIKSYSATASIKNFDEAPNGVIVDEAYKVGIARMGTRIRISGAAELGSHDATLRDAAISTLIKVSDDWFPVASNYRNASFWSGTRAMLPDGVPLLGATPIKGVYVNAGHGATGWTMAMGAGKVVSDIVSGHTPDIDMSGLTLSRYQ